MLRPIAIANIAAKGEAATIARRVLNLNCDLHFFKLATKQFIKPDSFVTNLFHRLAQIVYDWYQIVVKIETTSETGRKTNG
jgi:hypothetical protein